MMTEPRQIAVVRDYDELIHIIRQRVVALDCPLEPLEEFLGLARGYLGKIHGQAETKRIGLFSLWKIFEGLGLVMAVHEHLDLAATIDEMGEKYRRRMPQARTGRMRRHMSEAIRTAAAQHYGSLGRGIPKTFGISRRQLRDKQSKAAKARWHKPRIIEILAAPTAKPAAAQPSASGRKLCDRV